MIAHWWTRAPNHEALPGWWPSDPPRLLRGEAVPRDSICLNETPGGEFNHTKYEWKYGWMKIKSCTQSARRMPSSCLMCIHADRLGLRGTSVKRNWLTTLFAYFFVEIPRFVLHEWLPEAIHLTAFVTSVPQSCCGYRYVQYCVPLRINCFGSAASNIRHWQSNEFCFISAPMMVARGGKGIFFFILLHNILTN